MDLLVPRQYFFLVNIAKYYLTRFGLGRGGLIAKCFELMMLKIVKGVRHEKFCRPLVLEALTRTGEALIFEFKSLIAFYVWAIDV